MNQKNTFNKDLAFAIILLFIGIAFAPSVNANAVKEDFVEFDVEFCGLNKKHTARLTQQEADEVELLFDEIHQQLENVESRAEAEEIFKEAVVELDKYGLLGGLSIRQAQKLIIGNKLGDYILRETEDRYSYLINMNIFCFIAGSLTNTFSFSPIHYILDKLGIKYFLTTFPYPILGFLMQIYFHWISPIIYTYSPVNVLKIVTAGYTHYGLHSPPTTRKSNGLIITFGLLGLKIWGGENLIGDASDTPIIKIIGGPDGEYKHFYPAFIGFNGIKIITPDYYYPKIYYLGFALKASFTNV